MVSGMAGIHLTDTTESGHAVSWTRVYHTKQRHLTNRWIMISTAPPSYGKLKRENENHWRIQDLSCSYVVSFHRSFVPIVDDIPGRYTLRASSCGNLVVPRTRRRIGDSVYSMSAPRAWNRLSTELKLLRSTDSFRRDLKIFLFDSVYGHRDTNWLCDAPSVSSRGRNTSASVTVTVSLTAFPLPQRKWSTNPVKGFRGELSKLAVLPPLRQLRKNCYTG